MDSYKPRAKNFYTPVVKKELAFADEERFLQRTLPAEKLRHGSTLGYEAYKNGQSEWDRDTFYTRTVSFSK